MRVCDLVVHGACGLGVDLAARGVPRVAADDDPRPVELLHELVRHAAVDELLCDRCTDADRRQPAERVVGVSLGAAGAGERLELRERIPRDGAAGRVVELVSSAVRVDGDATDQVQRLVVEVGLACRSVDRQVVRSVVRVADRAGVWNRGMEELLDRVVQVRRRRVLARLGVGIRRIVGVVERLGRPVLGWVVRDVGPLSQGVAA